MKRLGSIVGGALIICLAGMGSAQAQSALALVGATISDPSREPSQFVGTVVIDGERITQVGPTDRLRIPAAAERIDLTGKFIVPGLIDVHVHFFEATENGFVPSDFDRLLEYPRWGVTSVFDFSSAAESLSHATQLADEYPAPKARYFGNGPPFSPSNNPAPTADEIRARVGALRSAGWQIVGILHEDSDARGRPAPRALYSQDAIRTIFNESHARSLPVIVQASSRRTAADALEAGAHALMHGIHDVPFDDEFLGMMRRIGAFYVPTHSFFESRADAITWSHRLEDFDRKNLISRSTFESIRAGQEAALTESFPLEDNLPILRENLRRIQEAGIPIALGTDSGVPGSVVGLSSQIELALYVEAGLTPEQALRSATVNAARMIGVFDQLGSIEEGKLADLVVLSADPFEDIRNIRDIQAVYVGGMLVR